jgi:DNA-binding CsgD family transcriptional regulator
MEKKLILSDKHLMLENSNKVTSLCDPLSSIEICYFNYQRYYNDGKGVTLSTHPEYIMTYYRQGIYATVTELEEIYNLHGCQDYAFDFFSSSFAATDHLSSIESRDKHRLNISLGEKFNIADRIYFLVKQKDFYELLGFGCNNKKDFVSFCARNLHVFKEFIKYFKSNTQQMIKNTPCIEGPPLLINEQTAKEDNDSELLNLFCSKEHNLLTSKEQDCLFYLFLGKTMQQIGASLCISARTVESYINRIKRKTNLHTKNQLIDFFLSNYFFEDDTQNKLSQVIKFKYNMPPLCQK